MSFHTEINNRTSNCPYCGTGHENLELIESNFIEKGGHQVRCNNCGARGPEYDEPVSAISQWNEVAGTYNWETP